MNNVSTWKQPPLQVVHLNIGGQCHDTSWWAALEEVRRRLAVRELENLPHGQKELALIAVGAYVALGGEV